MEFRLLAKFLPLQKKRFPRLHKNTLDDCIGRITPAASQNMPSFAYYDYYSLRKWFIHLIDTAGSIVPRSRLRAPVLYQRIRSTGVSHSTVPAYQEVKPAEPTS